MENILLLSCLLLGALFTSCLEEDPGLDDMDSVRELTNYETVMNGSGLPREIEIRNAVYTNSKNGETKEVSLGHVTMRFSPCADAWCRARTDDCGASANLDYLYEEGSEGSTIAFRDLAFVPTFRDWAATAVFRFDREGAELEFNCTDCDGETSEGFVYTDRKIITRVIE